MNAFTNMQHLGIIDDILDFRKKFIETQHSALLKVITEEYEKIQVDKFVDNEIDKLTKAGFDMDAIFEYEKRLNYLRNNFEHLVNICSSSLMNQRAKRKGPYCRNEQFMYRVVSHAFRYEQEKGIYPECQYEGFNDNHSVGYLINNSDYLDIIIHCPDYLMNWKNHVGMNPLQVAIMHNNLIISAYLYLLRKGSQKRFDV